MRIPNPKTLGVRIDSREQIRNDSVNQQFAEMSIDNIVDYFNAFYIIIIEEINRMPLVKSDWDRTISVSSEGIAPKIKKLSPEEKKLLIDSGESSVKRFFAK